MKADLCKFKDSLVYISNSRTIAMTKWDSENREKLNKYQVVQKKRKRKRKNESKAKQRKYNSPDDAIKRQIKRIQIIWLKGKEKSQDVHQLHSNELKTAGKTLNSLDIHLWHFHGLHVKSMIMDEFTQSAGLCIYIRVSCWISLRRFQTCIWNFIWPLILQT